MRYGVLLAPLAATLLSSAGLSQTREPLSINGLAPGDTEADAGVLGACKVKTRTGLCSGSTSYGPDAQAMFSYVAKRGKIEEVSVAFDQTYFDQILVGLKKRYGEPTESECAPKGSANCSAWVWTWGGVSLTLSRPNIVEVARAAP